MKSFNENYNVYPIALFIILIFFHAKLFSQDITVNGANLILKSGAVVVAEDVRVERSGTYHGNICFLNSGSNFIIEGDLYNNDNQDVDMNSQSGTGTVTFAKSGTQILSYNSNMIIFNGLTVNSGSSVEVPATKYLTVKGDLVINGALTLQSNSSGTASLLDGNCYGSVSNTGDLSVQRYLTTDQNNPFYHYVSSPVANAPLSAIQDQNYGNYNVYWYDETNPSSNLDIGWTRISSGNLTQGRGYTATYLCNSAITRTFTGSLSTGNDINIYCTYTSSSGTPDPQGWNLIGNPYPSPISVVSFITYNTQTNQRLTGTLYYWSDVSGTAISRNDDYATVNLSGGVPSGIAAPGNQSKVPGGFIGIGQGFFVKVDGSYGSGNVVFKNSFRQHETGNQFFVPDLDTTVKFRLNLIDSDSNANNILITFLPNATDGFDPMYDGHKLQGNKDISLYSLSGKDEWCIQALPPLTSERVIPIGLKAGLGGKYTFFNGDLTNMQDIEVYLEDKKLNKTINLTSAKEYSFETEKGIINQRFLLRFKPQSNPLEEPEKGNESVSIQQVGKMVLISFENLLKENISGNVSIFDASGKLLYNSLLTEKTNYIPLPETKGCYLVSVVSSACQLSKKVVVY